jgi:glutamyl/glutaminyl-tRNA synthetase
LQARQKREEARAKLKQGIDPSNERKETKEAIKKQGLTFEAVALEFIDKKIKEGKAYIDEQTSEQIAAQKGTPTQPGVESPYRNRPIEETLDLFQKMNSGEIEEGAMVLRAKIDMASPNMHFRDPIIYRVVKHPHHRTGTTWKAYPMYDFAHGQSDFFEGVTHSLCTLEFVPHRPLYDLFVDWVKEGKDLDDNRPHQYEFNKLNLSYTLMSKRNLLTLVKEGLVNGWDDPRMPTICGFRRRGYSPESIHKFIDKIGYTTYDALNEFALLESAVREDLNDRATRVSAALILSKLDETDTLELHTMDNAIILLKKDMTLVETRDVLQGMVRLARSMTLDALCNSDAEDKTPLVDESVDDEYEDTITIPVPLEAFGDAGLLGKDLHIQVIDGAVVITEDTDND